LNKIITKIEEREDETKEKRFGYRSKNKNSYFSVQKRKKEKK